MAEPKRSDPQWPSAPARFLAAGVLGVASLAGLTLSLTRAPTAAISRGIQSAQLGPTETDTAPESAGTVNASATPAGPSTASPLSVNINAATAAELELLPGIGPALAQRIIEERTRLGSFKSIEDLDKVRGIGPRTLERLRPLVRVE